MNTPQAEYLSISATKCRDEKGRFVLLAKVHGGGYLYASLSLNGGCIILAHKLANRHALVTVSINGSIIAFVVKVKPRKRNGLAVAIPIKLKGLFKRGDVVEVKLRPIEGDDHGGK